MAENKEDPNSTKVQKIKPRRVKKEKEPIVDLQTGSNKHDSNCQNREIGNILATGISDVQTIYHMADIHIRNDLDRYKEYEEVFELVSIKMRSSVQSSGHDTNSLIIVVGDLFNEKSQHTNECWGLANKFLTLMTNIAPVVIVSGNHDCILTNSERMDGITPLVSNVVYKNPVYYLKKSGTYLYANLLFCVSTVDDILSIDEINGTLQKTKIDDSCKKIFLYHGDIKGAKYCEGVGTVNAKYTPSELSIFDYVMLGHIHKQQFIGDRICYPSSLIQQTFGEEVDDHGIVKWTINKKAPNDKEFIPIKNNYAFITLDVQNSNIPQIDNIPKNTKIKVRYTSDTLNIAEVLLNIQKKYNPIVMISEKKDINLANGMVSKEIENLQHYDDKKYYLTLSEVFEQYINSLSMVENTKQRLIKLNSEILLTTKETDKKRQTATCKWRILKLKYSNILCYGENNELDFTNKHGVIGLFSPNFSGKTALVDTILFAIFSDSGRGCNIIRNGEKNGSTEITLNKGNKKYKIVRRIMANNAGIRKKEMYNVLDKKRNREKTIKTVKLFDITDEQNEINLTEETATETNKKIETLFGTMEDLLQTCVNYQGQSTFDSSTKGRRKETVQRLLNIQYFDSANKYAKDELFKKNTELDIRTKMLKGVDCVKTKQELTSQQEQLSGVTADYEKSMEILKKTNEKIMILLRKLHNIPGDISSKIADCCDSQIESIKSDIIKKKKDKNQMSDEISKYEEEIADLKKQYSQNEYETLVKEKEEYFAYKKIEINKIRKQLDLSVTKLEPIVHIDENEEILSKECQEIYNRIEANNISEQKLFRIKNKLEESIVSVNQEKLYELSACKEKYVTLGIEIEKLYDKVRELDETIANSHHFGEIIAKLTFSDKCNKCSDNLMALTKYINSADSKIAELLKNRNDLITKKYNKEKEQTELKKKADDHDRLKTVSDSNESLQKRIAVLVDKHNRYDLWRKKKTLDLNIKKQILAQINRNKELEKRNAEVKNEQEALIRKIKQLEDIQFPSEPRLTKLQCFREKITAQEGVIQKETIKREGISIDICLLEYRLNDLEHKKGEVSKYIEQAKENESINEQVSKYTNKKEKLELETNESQQSIATITEKIKSLKGVLTETEETASIIATLKEDVSLYEQYIKLTGVGGISQYMFNKFIPALQDVINSILSTIAPFRVEVTAPNDIIITRINDTNSSDMDQCSGYEKFVINLAFKMAISRFSNNSTAEFMITDEGFDCMDESNLRNIATIFEFMNRHYVYTIIISHQEEMKNLIDEQQITIYKKNGVSYAQFNV